VVGKYEVVGGASRTGDDGRCEPHGRGGRGGRI